MTLILIAVFSFWFVEIVRLPGNLMKWLYYKGWVYKGIKVSTGEQNLYYERVPRRIKPFDCTMCLSFWLALWFCFLFNQNYLLAPACSTLAVGLSLFTNRYLK